MAVMEIYVSQNILLLQNCEAQMFEVCYHCLVVSYQACSNGGSKVENGPNPGGPGFEP